MNTADKQIADILARYGEPFAGNVWRVQGNAVIYHKALERIAAQALLNVNYRVSGKQAAYVYAMAEKRAKDRVILKLIELHGLVYSEEEADEFKESRPISNENTPVEAGSEQRAASDLKRKISACKTTDAVTDLMTQAETQQRLADLPQALKDQIRDHAKARMVALGWTPKKEKAA